MEIHITPWSDKKNSFLIPLSLFLFVFKSIFDSNNAVNFQKRCQINLTFNEPILRVKMYSQATQTVGPTAIFGNIVGRLSLLGKVIKIPMGQP